MKQLEYPYDSDFILRKKKAIKRELLAREGIQYVEKKIAILGGSTTSDIKQIQLHFRRLRHQARVFRVRIQ